MMSHTAPAFILTLLWMVGPLYGQQTNPDEEPREPGTASPELPEDIAVLRRAPLLAEGSLLDDVPARLIRADDARSWRMQTIPRDDRDTPHTLIILPGSRLEDMQHVVSAAQGDAIVFHISGEVYVYEARNYVLITHAPHLVIAPTEDAPADAENETPATDDDGDAVEDISRMLERAAGPVRRGSSRTAPRDVPQRSESADEAPRGFDAREGDVLLNRRGRVVRDAGGALRFVFDADAEGGADPPAVLLPCLMLEELAAFTRRADADDAILLSGRTARYRDRLFLLPTSYRIAEQRTALVP